MLIPFGRGLNIIFATPEVAIPQSTSVLSLQAKRPYHLGFTKRDENTKLRGRSQHLESNSKSLIHVLLRPHKATVKKKKSVVHIHLWLPVCCTCISIAFFPTVLWFRIHGICQFSQTDRRVFIMLECA